MMITSSGLITRGLYRPLVPGKSERHYVMVGRTVGALVVVGAALIALGSGGLLDVLKLWWEFGVIFSAAMWMGVLWKRTNSKAVWVQLAVTLVAFFILPLALPALMPSLKEDPYLTRRTEARVVVNEYRSARPEDVARREAEIAAWKALPAGQQAQRPCPQPIEAGKPWERRTVLPRKSLFWSKGLELAQNENGEAVLRAKPGLNMLSFELVLLDKFGWDLSKNPHALNQTLRVLVRTAVPFILLVLVSLLTSRSKEEEKAAEKVAAKLLTPVDPDPEADQAAVAEALANPKCRDHLKLFPGSNWQLRRWNRTDTVGFFVNLAVVAAILGLLFLLVKLGG
jgi:SSS family solute:Na+ symporter